MNVSLPQMTALVLASWLLVSCGVDAAESFDSGPRLINTCEVDTDCKSTAARDGVCADRMCVAPIGQIDKAYLEVVPPASARYGAGDSFVLVLEGVSHGSYASDLILPEYAVFEGMVTTLPSVLGEIPSDDCEQVYDPSSQSLQVHVELYRNETPNGLPGWSVLTNAERPVVGASWVFKGSAPPGTYDMYATAMGGCEADFPPLFAPGLVLASGRGGPLTLHVSALSTLSGTVTAPRKTGGDHVSLDGWTVWLVEPTQGKVISTTRKLNHGATTNFRIRYQTAADRSPLVQIIPPKEMVAPVVTWDLSVLDLDADGVVDPDLSSLDLATVQVTASVVDSGFEPVASASVRLRSTALLGASLGLNARYDTLATTDADGMINLPLLPGTYQVDVVPPDYTDLSITQAVWTVGRSPAFQAGRTIEVERKQTIQGSVKDPIDNRVFEEIAISVSPSLMRSTSYYERLFELPSVLPRATSSITGAQGVFVVGVDPGIVDIIAQPSESSKFPWMLHANVGVPRDPMGEMHISYPVLLAGTLRDPTDGYPVQQAKLRVFAVTNPGSSSSLPPQVDATAVHLIAQGRTDKNGAFTLLLPSEFNAN